MDPILEYIKHEKLPENINEARTHQLKAVCYTILDEKLYSKGFTSPLYLCDDKERAAYVLAKIHEGIWGNYSGGHSLVKKALRQGYYWPTMQKDTFEYVKKCNKSQLFAMLPYTQLEKLTSMTSFWPFAVWGINIIKALPTRTRGVKYVVVIVDYFTKWTETETLKTITTKKMIQLYYMNIVSRYGIPHKMVSDNGLQFNCVEF